MQNYDHYPKLFFKIWTSIVKIRTLCTKSHFYKHKKIGEFDFFIESTDFYPFFSSTRPHGKKQSSTIPSAWQKAVIHNSVRMAKSIHPQFRPHGKKQSSMQQQCCCLPPPS